MSSPQVITIGRASDNSLVVNKPSVSKHHATLTFITDHVFLLKDENSTFGTNVDGRRILQTIIGPDSQVLLGQVEPLDYRQILALRIIERQATFAAQPVSDTPPPAPMAPHLTARVPPVVKEDPLDFREEFKELAKVQELYLQARESIQINSPRQQARLRAAFGLIPLVGLVLGPLGIVAAGAAAMVSGAAVLGAAVSQIMAAEFINPSQKLIALEKEFKRTYMCPNPACKKPFGNTPHADLAARKQCPGCKAKWAD